MAILGSLLGFHYFQPWLRGKEELLLTIVNEDLGWPSPGFPASVVSSCTSPTCSSSYNLDSDYASFPLPIKGPQLQLRPQSPQSTQQQPSSVGGADSLAKDTPMKLKSITYWVLTYQERLLATGALLNFLEMIVVQGSRKEPFYDLGGCHAGNSEPAESGFTLWRRFKSLRQLLFQSLAELLKHRNVQSKSLSKLDSAEEQQPSSNSHGPGDD